MTEKTHQHPENYYYPSQTRRDFQAGTKDPHCDGKPFEAETSIPELCRKH